MNKFDKDKRKMEYAVMAAGFLLFVILVCLRLFPSAGVWLLCAAAALLLAWYAMCGFVGLAFWFSQIKKTALSNFFLAITIRPTLLPFRKAFYLWTKSVNLIQKNPTDIQKADFEKAFALAKKVNPDKLDTYNSKAMFLSWLAVLYYDSGERETAYHCIEEAQSLPYSKPAIGEALGRLVEMLAQSEKFPDNPNINTEDTP